MPIRGNIALTDTKQHIVKTLFIAMAIPYHEVGALTRVLLPEMQAFFESEEGQREYAEWKAGQQAEQQKQA